MSETLLNAAYSTSVSGLHAAGTAMQAMKQALEAMTYLYTEVATYEEELLTSAITALREQLGSKQ